MRAQEAGNDVLVLTVCLRPGPRVPAARPLPDPPTRPGSRGVCDEEAEKAPAVETVGRVERFSFERS